MEPLPAIPEPAKAARNDTSAGVKKNSGEEFSPMLDKAVTNKKEKASHADTETSGHNEDSDFAHTSQSTTEDVTKKPENDNLVEAAMEESAKTFVEGLPNSQNIIPGNVAQETQSQKLQAANQATISLPLIDSEADLSTITVNMQEQKDAVSQPSKAGTLLMQQIQQIIDEGQNKGAIVIKGSTETALSSKESAQHLQTLSNPGLETSGDLSIQTRQTGSLQMIAEDKVKTAVPQPVNTETSRQNVTEQFINAKFADSDKKQNENNQQQNEQRSSDGQNKNTLQQTVVANSVNTLSADAGIAETGFSHQMGISTSTAPTTMTTPASMEAKYVPGATVLVPEDKMVDTLIQRFNSNPRLQTSKLTMQLHPVELGKLKVDITVKENTISANIVAGSQQVLETLEKNITRLRTVLENQGFTVEAFTISTKTSDESGQELFHEQFDADTQEYLAEKETEKHDSEVFDSLLDGQDLSAYSSESLKSINLTA
jgi:flagellar hook-length control protein FliK